MITACDVLHCSIFELERRGAYFWVERALWHLQAHNAREESRAAHAHNQR